MASSDAHLMVAFLTDGVFVYTHAPEAITDEFLDSLINEPYLAFIVAEGEVDPALLTKIRSRFTLSQPFVDENLWTPNKRYTLYTVYPR
jgi:hypothetical protein